MREYIQAYLGSHSFHKSSYHKSCIQEYVHTTCTNAHDTNARIHGYTLADRQKRDRHNDPLLPQWLLLLVPNNNCNNEEDEQEEEQDKEMSQVGLYAFHDNARLVS